ncbi:MAG: hypothetical protein ACRD4C_14560 [Candidatus Acidiferrales bacterium]
MARGGIALHAHMDDASKQLSRDIFRHLIEINVTDSAGSTTVAAEAMAQRLRDAGFPTGDVRTHGRDERVRANSYYDGTEFYYR